MTESVNPVSGEFWDRARDVETLDEWIAGKCIREWRCMCETAGEEYVCELIPSGDVSDQLAYVGATPDAARHAAAEAIRKGEVP